MNTGFRSLITFLLFLLLLFSFSYSQASILETQQNSEPVIVFAGASNTNEIQWSNGSYFSKLQEIGAPWDNSTMINSSEDRWGTRNYYENETTVEDKISGFNPNYVFIVLGGNDILRLVTPSDFEVQLNWLIDFILSNDVGKNIQMIFIANIYWVPLDLTGILVERYFEYQNIIGNTSLARNLIELDFFQATLDKPEFFVSDGIHLNEAGHLAIAQLVNNQAGPVILGADNSFYENEHTNPMVSTSTTSSTISKSPIPSSVTTTMTEEMSSIDSSKDETSLDYKYFILSIPIYLAISKRKI